MNKHEEGRGAVEGCEEVRELHGVFQRYVYKFPCPYAYTYVYCESASGWFFILAVYSPSLEFAPACVLSAVQVLEGMDIVRLIEGQGSRSGSTKSKITIADSGELPV